MKPTRRSTPILKYLTPIAATALVLLILLATTLPLMQWWTQQGADALFADNRALWVSHGIANYDLSVEQRCDCAAEGAYRVTVRGGTAVAALDARGADVSAGSFPSTIESVFAAAEDRISADADAASVVYDEVYGFPRRVEPSGSGQTEHITLLVTSFRPVSAVPDGDVE